MWQKIFSRILNGQIPFYEQSSLFASTAIKNKQSTLFFGLNLYNEKQKEFFVDKVRTPYPVCFELVSKCLKKFRHISHLCYTYIKGPLDQLTNKQLTTSYLDASTFRSPDIRHYHVHSRVLQMNSHIVTSFSDNPRIFMRWRHTCPLKTWCWLGGPTSSFQWTGSPSIRFVELFLVLNYVEHNM